MGAHSFSYHATGGENDGEKLFNALSEEDARSYGDDPYTGDIGQKHGFELATRRILLPTEVDDYVHENTDRNGKWDGTALAVRVAKVTGQPKTKVVKVRAASKDEAIQKARAKAKSGKRPVTVKVVKAKATGSVHSTKVKRAKLPSAKPRIRWSCGGSKTYATAIEAARAAEASLKRKVAEDRLYNTTSYTVVPVVESDGGAYKVTIGRNDKVASWEVELETRVVAPDKVGGWVFFGMCAS
jgi:hypothetical protein